MSCLGASVQNPENPLINQATSLQIFSHAVGRDKLLQSTEEMKKCKTTKSVPQSGQIEATLTKKKKSFNGMGKWLRDALYCSLRTMKVFNLFLFVAANKDCRLHLRGFRVVTANWQQQCLQAAMQVDGICCRWRPLSNLLGFNIKCNTWLTPLHQEIFAY